MLVVSRELSLHGIRFIKRTSEEHAEQRLHCSVFEIRVTHSTVPIFANTKRSVDPLQTIELDEQRSTPCHENETEKQRTEREAREDLYTAVQSSFNLGISLLS